MKHLNKLLLIGGAALAVCGMLFLYNYDPTGKEFLEGSEAAYCGTVTDRAMSTIDASDSKGYPYLSITTDAGEGILFWVFDEDVTPDGLAIGDRVEIVSRIEARRKVPAAVRVTALEAES